MHSVCQLLINWMLPVKVTFPNVKGYNQFKFDQKDESKDIRGKKLPPDSHLFTLQMWPSSTPVGGLVISNWHRPCSQ